MGTIPVIETLDRKDGWFRTFDRLPVAWIDRYENLTPQWLEDEYERILRNEQSDGRGHYYYQWDKLTKHYWTDLVLGLTHLDNKMM